MCGRISFVATKEQIQQALPFVEVPPNLRTSYNIAPTQHVWVIANDAPDRLQQMVWGLVPSWWDGTKQPVRPVNARAEGIATRPSFRVPIRKQRCVVLADSFYEWRKEGTRKLPYRIFPKDGGLLLMGGIWDVWHQPPNGYPHKSCAIITTPSNREMSCLHDRMPFLLAGADQVQLWLDDLPLDEVLAMLQPAPDGLLRMYRVTDKVNNYQFDDPACHEPVPEDLDLFSQR